MTDKEESFGIIPVYKKDDDIFYLLIRHRAGHWGFPKGHADPGETPLETAQRELFEETGISDCRLIPDYQISEQYEKFKKGKSVPKTVTYFLGTVTNDKVQICVNELSEYAWLNYDDARKKISYDASKQTLDRVKKRLAS
jgi:8-oxo-dGTP pyrophosphatase MutT (NUDIX family)